MGKCYSEAATGGILKKIAGGIHGKTPAPESLFLIKLQAFALDSSTGIFLWKLRNFYRTLQGGWFLLLKPFAYTIQIAVF